MGNKSKNNQPNMTAIVEATSIQHYAGPIPQASEIAKYEEIIPGAANRIF